jgi:hypothetical protein
MNEKEKDIITNGDIGQGDNLVKAKMKQQLKNSNYEKEKRSASKASSNGSGSNGSPNVIDYVK